MLILNTFLTLTTPKEQMGVYFYFQSQNIDNSKITTNKISNVHRTNGKIEGILGKKIDWPLISFSYLFVFTYSCWLTWLIGRSCPFLIRIDSKYFPNFTKLCDQSTSYIRVGGMHVQFIACKSSIQQAPKSEFKFFVVDLNTFIFLKI